LFTKNFYPPPPPIQFAISSGMILMSQNCRFAILVQD
jgi:hypothetical protein